MARRKPTSQHMEVPETGYGGLVSDISVLVEQARHQAARTINGLLTATYWDVGRRIVEFEQKAEGACRVWRGSAEAAGRRPGREAWAGFL